MRESLAFCNPKGEDSTRMVRKKDPGLPFLHAGYWVSYVVTARVFLKAKQWTAHPSKGEIRSGSFRVSRGLLPGDVKARSEMALLSFSQSFVCQVRTGKMRRD